MVLRVGAVTGGGLGLVGSLVALLVSVTTSAENGPLIQSDAVSVILSGALIGSLMGVIIAITSRLMGDRVSPGMRLSSPTSATARLGAVVGLLLGALESAILTGLFATGVAGNQGPVEMPVIATFLVMVLGGILLGTVTAVVTQAADIPVAVSESVDEITTVRKRLTAALGVPLTALLILLIIVLPFAWALIESDHLASGGAVVVGIVASLAILAIATSGRTLPRLGISIGEGVLATTAVVMIIAAVAVLLVVREPGGPVASGGGGSVAITATGDITFDQNAWTSEEGAITIIYTDEGPLRHTLLVEGHESDLELEVKQDGQVDQGVINLPAGTYTLYCGIKGHRKAGMEGTLTVTATPAPPAT